jgi:hypothetical protein
MGAYGFRLDGPLPPDSFRVQGVSHWPCLRVEVEPDPIARPDEYVTKRFEGQVCLSHDLQVVRLPGAPQSTLVHPVLATAAVMAAQARGEMVVHAGGFVGPKGAWIVLGDRGRGKSTLLAEQHRRGVPIVADDICVIRHDRVCAGPRSLDLRPDAAIRLGMGLEQPVRGGQRYRVALPAIEGEVPLAGFIELEWSAAAALELVRPAERLTRLAAASGSNPSRPPLTILELAVLPYLLLRRSPTPESTEKAISLLHVELGRRRS